MNGLTVGVVPRPCFAHTFFTEDYENELAARELFCSGLFLQLLDELSRMAQSIAQARSYSPYIHRVKSYIFQHIHEPIRQAEVAARLRVTPEHLCAVFKKCEGTPLIPSINRTKPENMRAVMEKEGISLRAAALYGYSDPNYASRLYTRLSGRRLTDSLPEKL